MVEAMRAHRGGEGSRWRNLGGACVSMSRSSGGWRVYTTASTWTGWGSQPSQGWLQWTQT